ncbi:hypothetical protein GCM10007916_11100 [Psychromonas marina]|uniref:Uncharacterized protein n=1 Tax=Psychromonas marina TaxID=88364 RepID=A0ABQ6DYU3_9GAMM|nr:hypothetical protein [Psychromonas marina]GLS90043.1 hypothetical protein GCM10007916_11100 [Psychromonas marina]
MSTLSSINAIQQKITDLAATNNNDKSPTGESFGKVLDLAMSAKSNTSSNTENSDTDLGALGALSAISGNTSIEAGFEGLFNELSVGIAGSFAAALAGEDSATEVAPTAEEKAAAAAALADETTEDTATLAAKDNIASKEVTDEAVSPFSGNKAVQMASSALSALEDSLFNKDEDEEEQQKS